MTTPRTPENVIRDALQSNDAADLVLKALANADYKLVSRSALASDLQDAIEALSGDSNDAEHDALFNIAQSLAAYTGQDIDALMYPDGGEDE